MTARQQRQPPSINPPEVVEQLVRDNLGLVGVIVFGMRHHDHEELFAAGREGLFMAARRFDATRGTKFASFARWWIMRYVYPLAMQLTSQAHVPHHFYVDLFEPARKAMNEIRARGEPVTVEAVAAATGMEPKTATALIAMVNGDRCVRLDARRFDDSNETWGDVFAVSTPGADDELGDAMACKLVRDAVRELNPLERETIERRWLSDERPYLHELAAERGCSMERARRIEQAAMAKLKKKLSRKRDELF